MAAETQDLQRLVVSLEARLNNFDKAMAKMRGDTDRTLGQVEGRFKRAEGQIGRFGERLSKAFGFPIREGAIIGLGLAFANTIRHMDELEKKAKEAGIVIDQEFIQRADEFGDKWNRRLDIWQVRVQEAADIGVMAIGNLIEAMDNAANAAQQWTKESLEALGLSAEVADKISKLIFGVTLFEASVQVSNEAAKKNKETFDPAVIQKYKDALRELQEVQDEFIRKQKEMAKGASGLSDELQTFTDAVLDDYHKIGDAAKALAKDILRNIIHAGLFGTGPYAGVLGTQGAGGAPGGLIGGLITRILGGVTMGGGAAAPGFTSLAPEPVTGSGAITEPGSGKIQDQIIGGGGGPQYTPGPLSGTAGVNALIGGAGQDLLDAKDTLEKAQSDLESFTITHTTPLRFTPGGKIADRITPESPDYPVYKNAGIKEYLPLDTRETTYQPVATDEAVLSPVKSATRINRALKQTADVIEGGAKQAPKIAQGITQVAQSLSGHWGDAGGFPILNSVFGSFASYGGAYEHSIPFGGAMQGGGDINPGSAYLVGERGPEMITPRFPGRVEPVEGSGAGLAVHVTPSKYFDVHVERISARGNARALNAARKSFPNTASRLNKLGTV